MAHIKQQTPLNNDGSVNIDLWIKNLSVPEESHPLIHSACRLASITGEDQITEYGVNCFLKGLEIAEILAELKIDPESIAAGILYSAVNQTDLSVDDVIEQVGPAVGKIIKGVLQMNEIQYSCTPYQTISQHQINNIRKMLLAIISDVRVVIIKLAEILSDMRTIKKQDEASRKKLAQAAMEIFSPLANRLGLHTIKWELEDLAFFILNPEIYKKTAKALDEKRTERNIRVTKVIKILQESLAAVNIDAEVYGRAKHIYSICRKMLRKQVEFSEIYDAIAVRILVHNVDDCYKALSIAHEKWQPIPEEFDDYVTTPKANGYRSIHTAVIDEENKNFEIQIRTYTMHEEAEKGVAAHWMYKEGKQQPSSYEEKINCLRQLLEWRKELTPDKKLIETLEKNIFEDRVYVFTPAGEIIDLPANSTPLDFAYHIHTEIGHRCRGAKINGKIVPLTYKLQTSNTIEILTTKANNPSRDWLTSHRCYLKTSSARAKVLQWFKQKDYKIHLDAGKKILETELEKLNVSNVNLLNIAEKLGFKTSDKMLASLGNNSLRFAQITNLIPKKTSPELSELPEQPIRYLPKSPSNRQAINISGINNILSHPAKCCKPIPGEPIVGYITQNQGITIHNKNCKNIVYAKHFQPQRLIEIEWNETIKQTYSIDVEILAYDRRELVRDITALLANNKINLSHIFTTTDKKSLEVKIILTIDIDNLEFLNKILDSMAQLSNVHSVKRIKNSNH